MNHLAAGEDLALRLLGGDLGGVRLHLALAAKPHHVGRSAVGAAEHRVDVGLGAAHEVVHFGRLGGAARAAKRAKSASAAMSFTSRLLSATASIMTSMSALSCGSLCEARAFSSAEP